MVADFGVDLNDILDEIDQDRIEAQAPALHDRFKVEYPNIPEGFYEVEGRMDAQEPDARYEEAVDDVRELLNELFENHTRQES